MRALLRMLLHYLTHPIGRLDRLGTMRRILRWQVGSRVLGMQVAVPFVDDTRLLVRRGMHGATGNVYVGLMEFEDMAFALHLLGGGDLMVDVGANVGVYSILAASRCALALALEPVPETFQQLLDNIHLNRFETRVTARNIGVGAKCGELRFTTGTGPTNHVLTESENVIGAVAVPVDTLDAIVGDQRPVMLKIDVEGFETEVIRGAANVLGCPDLRAILIELNGLGARYGFDDYAIHAQLQEFGFVPVRYDPFNRRLAPLSGHNTSGNTLYVRKHEDMEARLRAAHPFCWNAIRM